LYDSGNLGGEHWKTTRPGLHKDERDILRAQLFS
jgi:hypothetical protein